MLDRPEFNRRVVSEIAGDDPLGLAPVNERLYGAVFPGINNFVRYIRVYSALSWTVRNVERYLERHESSLTAAQASELSKRALEKMELALTWVNMGSGLTGLVGSRRKFLSNNSRIDLNFDSFGESTTSYLDAVFYRPSLTNGLGFLEIRSGETYGCTESGRVLAEAFDQQARHHDRYEWLADVTRSHVRRSEVLSLHDILDVTQPSPAEREAFLGRFYPGQLTDQSIFNDVNRAASLTLVLRCIEAIGADGKDGATEDEIRIAMARGRTQNGKMIELSDVDDTQAWWSVLQLRQYERLALDTLFAVVERLLGRRMSQGKDISIDEASEAVAQAATASLGKAGSLKVGVMLARIGRLQGGAPTLYSASLNDSSLDLFERRRELLLADLDPNSSGAIAAAGQAAQGLIFCAVEASNLGKAQRMSEALEADPDKASLSGLAELVSNFAKDSIGNLIRHVVKHFVILRHFEVVAERSQIPDGKNRFRFIVGDSGLQRYDAVLDPMNPGEAQDRLHFVLLLLAQSGLINAVSERYRVTAVGRKRLRKASA